MIYRIRNDEKWVKAPTEKEIAEVLMKVEGGLIERKHLEKWVKRLKNQENMNMLKIWGV